MAYGRYRRARRSYGRKYSGRRFARRSFRRGRVSRRTGRARSQTVRVVIQQPGPAPLNPDVRAQLAQKVRKHVL